MVILSFSFVLKKKLKSLNAQRDKKRRMNMTNSEIKCFLTENAEENYRDFSSALSPGAKNMYGVRIPKLRSLAKNIAREDWRAYLDNAVDDSFEEIMLQGFVMGYARTSIDEALEYFKHFIPKINDWAINDCVCSTFKIARKHTGTVWNFLMDYVESDSEFEQRVVAVMLMDYFLTDDYIDRVFEVYDRLNHPGYYRMMGVAWGVATAYAKYPEKTHAYLLDNKLDDRTYNMVIQKMLESRRVSAEDKNILRDMKRN